MNIDFALAIMNTRECILNEKKINRMQKKFSFQSTNPRSAFRLKNFLHGSHALAPYAKPLDGTPQMVHGIGVVLVCVELFDEWSSMYSIGI